jgi:hypothetical protein
VARGGGQGIPRSVSYFIFLGLREIPWFMRMQVVNIKKQEANMSYNYFGNLVKN